MPLNEASSPGRGRWDSTRCGRDEDEGAAVAPATADALRPAPNFTVGGWASVHNSASTIRQRVKANTDAMLLKAILALNWTGPYKVLAERKRCNRKVKSTRIRYSLR